jgi:2-polyprenyl-3-methyl-5-hydroxy-6-metoxy-1,4-benzoquinol methylase
VAVRWDGASGGFALQPGSVALIRVRTPDSWPRPTGPHPRAPPRPVPLLVEEVGDVAGKDLLHLQCHFGLDTLSWARRGARVTGIDLSERSVEQARLLATETGLDARFVVSDVAELPTNLEGDFDVVFTTFGALNWLPDLPCWAEVVAHFTRPGGFFPGVP